MCSRKRDAQMAHFAVLHGDDIEEDRFSAKLRELKKQDPVITTLADTINEKIGGTEAYGAILVEDFNKLRGADLTEDQKKLHTVSQGQLTKWHTMFLDLFAKRDAMVGDHDSMGELDEEDLQAIVSQGASVRLQVDANFRMEMFKQILMEEPGIADRLMKNSLPDEQLVVIGAPYDPDDPEAYDVGDL